MESSMTTLECPSLLRTLTVDIVAAASAALCVAPIISIVDKSIVENASGRAKLLDSMRRSVQEMLLRPHVFARRPELWMIFGVYSATYSAANCFQSLGTRWAMDAGTKDMTKFCGTTATNVTAGIAKDRALAQMFGATAPRAVPAPTLAAFVVRDAITVAASFTLPHHIAERLHDSFQMSPTAASVAAQLTCPVGVQVASTPLHLTGLDFYNRPGQTLQSRFAFVMRELPLSTAARMTRIFPAFGIGGLSNKLFRDRLSEAALATNSW